MANNLLVNDLSECRGLVVPVAVVDAEPDADWIWNDETGECEWSGEYIDSDGDGVPDKEPASDDARVKKIT